MLDRIKKDVEVALTVWSEIFTDVWGDKISCAFAKGSAVKKWEGIIDYVPILSDLDIHIVDERPLFPGDDPIGQSLELGRMYGNRFIQLHPNHTHIPRIQIMPTSQFKNRDDYVPPDFHQVRFIIGDASHFDYDVPDTEKIRAIDRKRLLEEQGFLDGLPISLMDRVGLDYWQLIRRLCWRVSPSVVRVLSQLVDDPFSLWSNNRTVYHRLLIEHGFSDLAETYSKYYEVGWKLYESDFRDDDLSRQLIRLGSDVLRLSIEKL